MRFVAVTACPTGVAHTYLAAEALKRQASVMGHHVDVEMQGAGGTTDRLEPETVAAADAVIIAADIHIDPERFAGKPMHAVSTATAIRHTARVISDAVGAVAAAAGDIAEEVEAEEAGIVDEPPPLPIAPSVVDTGKALVGITSCPTGIAHTFMAAEGLRRAAEQLGHTMKVETQGSVGAKNVLTPEEIAAADAVIIAADTKVDLSRFAGKRIYQTGTKEALKHGDDVIAKALASSEVLSAASAGAATGGGGGTGSAATSTPAARGGWRGVVKGVYQNVMTGVSYMLPFVVAGGLLIAISFAVDIDANDPALADTFAGRLFGIGAGALALFLPVLAGFVAYSIADRPGLAPGFVGGYLAVQVDSGFLGALLAGFVAGYLTKLFAQHIKLPTSMQGLKPVLILPLVATLATGLIVYYVIGEPISWLQTELTDWLEGLQGSNAAVLGLILGAMMATDMGGPLNKVAYTFAVGLITSGVEAPMAAVMAAGMTPPLGLALATTLFPNRWLPDEHEAGKPAYVLGLSFITEGAIPFAARDPLRVLPACIAGSAVAGAISLGFGVTTVVPHGGIFVLFVPNATEKPLVWLAALVIGTVVTTSVLFFTKRPIIQPAGVPSLDAAAAMA
ncbi:MAG: PTS fructose-like transporter subunit IIB [Ilumatobacteraceae bacterium]